MGNFSWSPTSCEFERNRTEDGETTNSKTVKSTKGKKRETTTRLNKINTKSKNLQQRLNCCSQFWNFPWVIFKKPGTTSNIVWGVRSHWFSSSITWWLLICCAQEYFFAMTNFYIFLKYFFYSLFLFLKVLFLTLCPGTFWCWEPTNVSSSVPFYLDLHCCENDDEWMMFVSILCTLLAEAVLTLQRGWGGEGGGIHVRPTDPARLFAFAAPKRIKEKL